MRIKPASDHFPGEFRDLAKIGRTSPLLFLASHRAMVSQRRMSSGRSLLSAAHGGSMRRQLGAVILGLTFLSCIGSLSAAATFTTIHTADSNSTGVGGVVVHGTVVQDFGDAPRSYGTLLADDGACHRYVAGMYLGAGIDTEPDGMPHPMALGDDLSSAADEDGVEFGPLISDSRASVKVTASIAGWLNAWMDFNRDGAWTEAEQIFTNHPLIPGPNSLTFILPPGIPKGPTFARFRFSRARDSLPTGPAPDGEVEDYRVHIRGTQPIRLLFDLHIDPETGSPPMPEFLRQTTNLNWALDEVAPYNVPVSFLMSGWWAERVAAGADGGGFGRDALARVCATGQQVGTHLHNETNDPSVAFLWEPYPSSGPLDFSRRGWSDNRSAVGEAIRAAIPGADPSRINRVLGSHSPKREADFHTLMSESGVTIREPGPEQDYYAWFDHFIFNPYRPSAANYLNEDPGASFVQITSGSILGRRQQHHEITKDMTVPQLKRQFLQCYLNWRQQLHTGATPKVWSWGWGLHTHDVDPTDRADDASREALGEMVMWLDTHFAERAAADGSPVVQWDTHIGVGDAYFNWEAAHPGTSSFTTESGLNPAARTESVKELDWSKYTYLRPVAAHLKELGVVEALALGCDAFRLVSTNGYAAILLWRDSGTAAAVDLSPWMDSAAIGVNLETGVIFPVTLTAVSVGRAPILVAQDTDTDGLADPREDVEGTDIRNPDTDGDGASDGIEVDQTQTDPTSAASVLKLSISVAGEKVHLTWPSVAGVTYDLERNASLRPGSWISIATIFGESGSKVSRYQDDLHIDDCFYRIRVR